MNELRTNRYPLTWIVAPHPGGRALQLDAIVQRIRAVFRRVVVDAAAGRAIVARQIRFAEQTRAHGTEDERVRRVRLEAARELVDSAYARMGKVVVVTAWNHEGPRPRPQSSLRVEIGASPELVFSVDDARHDAEMRPLVRRLAVILGYDLTECRG